MKLPRTIKLIILSYLTPEETQIIRIASVEWNKMPKSSWSKTTFSASFEHIKSDIHKELKFAALADNLDMPSYIPHSKLNQLREMYAQIPEAIKQRKQLLSNVIVYYMQHGTNLMFHRIIKDL
jgi:hypothetical protein